MATQDKTIEQLDNPPMAEDTKNNAETLKKIEANIVEIKTSVATLKTEVEDFDKSKKTLDKETLTTKEKDIETKKIAIEAKKIETQTLIEKIRKDRIDLKLENLDETTKTVFETQKKKEETLLLTYENDLKTIEVTKPTFWEKIKNGGSKSWEWIKEHPIATGGIVLGTTLLIGWISGWFKKKKKNEGEDGDKEGGHKEKMSFWKKLLIGAGLGAGGILAWKNRDKIKDRFSGLFGPGEKKPPENNPYGDFEDLTEEMKDKYYTVSADIDNFSGSSAVGFAEEDMDDQHKKGEILFDLDKKIGNLSQFNKVGTLDYIEGDTKDGIFAKIGNWTKSNFYDVFGGFLSNIASFKPFGSKLISNPVEAVNERLKGGKPEERKKILSSFYQEYMNILSYVTNKKELILEKKAKEKVMGIANISREPTSDQKDLIEKLLKNETWCDEQLKNTTIADIPALLKTYAIEIKDVSKDTKDIKEKVLDDKKDILNIDDDGESALTRAETDFLDGSLDEDRRDELSEVCEKLGDDLFGKEDTLGFVGAYTHLLTDLFAGNTDLAKSYMEKMGLDSWMDTLKVTLQSYIVKLKNNTFTKQDLQELKTQTEVYFEKKAKFMEDINEIEKTNTGSGFDIGKILNTIFVQSFLDIGKAFGYGKINSRRERLGRGLGGAFVSGGVLYVTGTVAKGFGKGMVGTVLQVGGKSCMEIGAVPIKLLKEGITLSLGRSYLTGYGWSEAILKSGTKTKFLFTTVEQERLIKYAFLHGEISEKKALLIYENIGEKSVGSLDDLLDRFGIKDSKYKEIFKKYASNKNIRNLLIKTKRFDYVSNWKNIKHTVVDRVLRKDIELDISKGGNFDKLVEIDTFLSKSADQGKSSLIKGFLETTKSLKPEMYQELFATKTFNNLTPKESQNIGKILGKYMRKFESLQDFKDYQAFFLRHYATHPSETFVANSLSKRKKLRTFGKDASKESAYIIEKSLEKTFLEKRIIAMKNNFKKSAEALRKFVKEGRTPYPASVESTANGLDDIAKTSNEDLALLAESERIGTGNRLSAMSKDIGLIKKLSPLFKNDAFVKELSNAKTAQAVKELLASKGINNVPEEFTAVLSKTTNTKKIVDTMRYVERYETLGKIGKILQSPGMKYAGRILGITLGVGTAIFGGVLAYQQYQEGSKLMKTNKERGMLMQEESFVDIGLTAAGACAFIPGVGRVAAGVIVLATGVAAFVKESMFDTLDKYTKNYKDFIYSAPLLIKQHVITTILGGAKEDRGFNDRFMGINPMMEPIMKELAAKTGSEGVKALLYAEERKKNELVWMNVDDTELMDALAKETPPTTRAQIGEAKDLAEKNVQIKYEYLQKKCGTYTLGGNTLIDIKKIVSVDKIQNGVGMKLLDQLLLESEYALADPERFGEPEKIAQQQKELKKLLDQDAKKFGLLELFYAQDKPTILYMYRYMDQYRQHLDQYGFDSAGKCIEPAYDLIIKNMEYFDTYMKYKTIDQGIDIALVSAGFTDPNFFTVRNFFAGTIDKPLSSKELYASSSRLQTILYRIATEVIGVPINNTGADIANVFNENNEKTYGIYFENGLLNINGNFFGDAQYFTDDIPTLKKMRDEVQKQVNGNDLIDVGTGDTYLNKEIGNKYILIMNQEIQRP